MLACQALHHLLQIDAKLQENRTGVFGIFPFRVVTEMINKKALECEWKNVVKWIRYSLLCPLTQNIVLEGSYF